MELCASFLILFTVFWAVFPLSNAFTQVLRNTNDPCVIQVDNLYYMVAVSENFNHQNKLPIFVSENLKNWKFENYIFTAENFPTWANSSSVENHFSNPKFFFIDGSFLVYFATGSAAERNGRDYQPSGIGVAVGPTVTGPFQDKGAALLSKKDKFLTGAYTIAQDGK